MPLAVLAIECILYQTHNFHFVNILLATPKNLQSSMYLLTENMRSNLPEVMVGSWRDRRRGSGCRRDGCRRNWRCRSPRHAWHAGWESTRWEASRWECTWWKSSRRKSSRRKGTRRESAWREAAGKHAGVWIRLAAVFAKCGCRNNIVV